MRKNSKNKEWIVSCLNQFYDQPTSHNVENDFKFEGLLDSFMKLTHVFIVHNTSLDTAQTYLNVMESGQLQLDGEYEVASQQIFNFFETSKASLNLKSDLRSLIPKQKLGGSVILLADVPNPFEYFLSKFKSSLEVLYLKDESNSTERVMSEELFRFNSPMALTSKRRSSIVEGCWPKHILF